MKESTRNVLSTAVMVVALLVAAIATVTSGALAQSTQGSVVGTVSDSTGSVIPGASVTLTNTGTSEHRSGVTDDSGAYRFVSLIPGTYRIEVELAGFKRFVREPIVVEVESVVRINVPMQLGDLSETVEVTAATPLLQTQVTSLSAVVEGKTVEEMPLNGRNVLNLVGLISGVIPQSGAMGTTATRNNFSWGNYAIGGGQANQTGSYVDGAPVNVNYANLTALVPTQDAIAEFRVQTNNLSAEYGRFSGGVVNLSTKSGTNEFHGSAYEYFRNRALNANTFFSNMAGLKRPAFNQNQFGAMLSGPVVRDKAFFLFTYEGLRLRQGNTYSYTVPTLEMRNGDFSNARNSNGTLAVIYDPLTTCGVLGNPACAPGQKVLRTPFKDNKIPASRMDKTALLLMARSWALPNTAGNPVNNTANFVRNATAGGTGDQYNTRIDLNVSEKQHFFARYTRWNQFTPGADPMQVKLVNDEYNTTDQVVLADTYTFSPKMVGDFRIAFLRYIYDRYQPGVPFDMTLYGFPKWLNDAVPERFRILPRVQPAGFDGQGHVPIGGKNYSYSVSPSITQLKGRHTLKYGGEARKLDFNFFQTNSSGGQYAFTNLITAANPQAPTVSGASTGFSFASMMLGYGSSGMLRTYQSTASSMMYYGAYINDTFQATPKLTLNYGVRWEVPGPWTERFDNLLVFNPNEPNPILPAYKGRYDLVNSPEYASRYATSQHWNLFAPRLGVAYQANDNLVIRAGYGIFYTPSDSHFYQGPTHHPINTFYNAWAPTLDASMTPNDVLSNPFPNGIGQPISRDPGYQAQLLGSTVNYGPAIPDEPYGYNQQWNLNIQYQINQGTVVEIGYAGSRGLHLPWITFLNQLPEKYMALGGTELNKQVPNPFYGIIQIGTLAAKTVKYGQLLRPYPQYDAVNNAWSGSGWAAYNALNTRIQRRFQQGGVLTASYTWSKNMGIVETATNWLDGPAGVQNYYNLEEERAISSGDVPHRFVGSYVLDLPMGSGKRLFGNATGFLSKLISGWGINGIVNFQTGFPLHMTMQNNLTNSFGGGSRPNVVEGCDPNISGRAQDKINKWFDTACYSAPAASTFGNAPRNEARLRAAGVNNFDLSLTKNTKLTEKAGLQFRAELFNLFNRVQFGAPNQSMGSTTFGRSTTQSNLPRVAQFALRLVF